jgi:hypothetical protein
VRYVIEQEAPNLTYALRKFFRFVSADSVAISRVLAAEAHAIKEWARQLKAAADCPIRAVAASYRGRVVIAIVPKATFATKITR